MLDTKGRHHIDKPVIWLARLAGHLGMVPDQVTLLSFLFGVLAGVAMAMDRPFAGIALLWISGLLDVVDGQLARLTNSSSKSGAFLDLILDRMVEAAFVGGMVLADTRMALPVIAFLIMVIFNFSTFLAAGSLTANTGVKSMHYDIGLIERTETFLFFTAAAVFTQWRGILISLLAGLILITGVIRFTKIYKQLKNL